MDPSAPKAASKQECLKQKKSPLRLRGGGGAKVRNAPIRSVVPRADLGV